MAAPTPSPQTYTLRLKSHRTTLLLHTDPLQTLLSLKREILRALFQTHPEGHLNGAQIPKNAEDILLAKPVDAHDLSAGWVSLETSGTGDLFEDDVSSKGKGKAAVNGTKKKGPGRDGTVQAAGLRDGGVVAFKFRSTEAAARMEDDEDDEGIAELGVVGVREEKWDVVVPNLDETYGEGAPIVEAPVGGEED